MIDDSFVQGKFKHISVIWPYSRKWNPEHATGNRDLRPACHRRYRLVMYVYIYIYIYAELAKGYLVTAKLHPCVISRIWPRPRPRGFGLGLASISLSYYVIGHFSCKNRAKFGKFGNYFWPRPWPPPCGPGLGLGLETLASASASGSRFWPRLTSLERDRDWAFKSSNNVINNFKFNVYNTIRYAYDRRV